MMNVLLKEAHPITAIGIHNYLEKELSDVDITIAGNRDEIFKEVKERNIDLIILDTEWSIKELSKTIKLLSNTSKKSSILVFGDEHSRDHELLFIKMGASGFISKDSTLQQFVNAIKLIHSGQLYISKQSFIKDYYYDSREKNALDDLSIREKQVFLKLTAGRSVNEISREMRLRQSTISTYKKRVMEKLGAATIVDLVKIADKFEYDL
jgi:DNA-binding NarL/FixJ family response regulator